MEEFWIWGREIVMGFGAGRGFDVLRFDLGEKFVEQGI